MISLNKSWKNQQTEIQLMAGEDVYDLVAVHSGYDYPARITSDPESSHPAEFECNVTSLLSGLKNGVGMTTEQLADLLEDHHEEITELVIDQ